ncbi:DUF397 domain-containing protein [Gandjariella thermophila]|uniref:DUF397 domain-containing protein n=1 Tax=Gandjariella thermophila TaxID=1931992 RepID=A0A4D4J553_9PSEU|nr:DUF397 domain-containing protein [Gandjariella thermophila]GDY29093.1 hypothetical protein GTS_07260 [Gandjariella thermophila]
MTSTRWRKSSYSGGNPQTSCVELSNTLDEIRDSKNPTGPTLRVDVVAFVRAVKSGQFDQAAK